MKRREKLWAAALVITIAVMAAIICFSAQSAAESNGLSKGLAEMLMAAFPALENVATVRQLNHFLRKFAHFSLYFVLGCGLTGVASRQKKIPAVLLSILAGTVFAATDEIHQVFSDSRGPMIQDVFLDACGVAVGSTFAYLCKKCLQKWRIIS